MSIRLSNIEMAIPYKTVCDRVLHELQPRARDIVARRFGLADFSPQTLEAIGSSYGITRERVRQVTDDVISNVQKKILSVPSHASVFAPVFRSIVSALKKEGTLKREDLLLDALNARAEKQYVIFLLVIGPDFHYRKETKNTHAFWALHPAVRDIAPFIVQELVSRLEKERRTIASDELEAICRSIYAAHSTGSAPAPHARSVFEISKHIAKSHEGEWGLRSWPEVHPKGIREKAYLVLKREGKPLHFSQVARRIEDLQRLLAFLKEKPVLSQTVHNELIKDPRFVLVGRGMYGLSDWGYSEGTVKDVIRKLLGKHPKGLTKQEIVRQVLSQRNVQETTIALNLQDHSLFSKDDQGRYHLLY